MSARRKLNHIHLAGDFMLAGVAGLLAESWPLFFLAFALLVGVDLHAGQIRPWATTCPGKPKENPLQRHPRRGEAP